MNRTGLASMVVLTLASLASAGQPVETGFEPLFDGKTLNGWHASAQTGHSRKSGNKSGGRWVVEDGAIVGSQDIPGNGGILITDKQFGDFEIALEMNNDFGPDSGLFLRCDRGGHALPGDDRLSRRPATSWASTARGWAANRTCATSPSRPARPHRS